MRTNRNPHLFESPSKEKLASLKVKPRVATPEPAPEVVPAEPDVRTDLDAVKSMALIRTVPIEVKLLADNLMSNPRAGLKTHAEAVGMSVQEARRALRRTDVKAYIDECLTDAGASVEASCKAIGEAMAAVRIVGTMPDPNDHKAKIPIHAPDHEYRLRAAEMALKLRGLLQQNAQAEAPLTLPGLIMAIQQERQRRGLDQPTP